jgi:fructokinase
VRIGLDLGGTKLEGIALDDAGIPLARRRVATPRHDYGATVEAMAGLVRDLEAETGRRGTVGVGMPGALSPATGLVKNANSTWLIGQPLDRDLSGLLERPVRFANDANCFALSEAVDGAAAGARVVFGVIVGTGTGGGIAVERKVLTGPNAIAGEWGHNPLPLPRAEDLPLRDCYCGRKGCIETYLSGPALQKDPDMGRYEERLARALAGVINILDPGVVVLGGGISSVASLYTNVPVLWRPHVFSDQVKTRLARPVHGDSSGVRGAAWLWGR